MRAWYLPIRDDLLAPTFEVTGLLYPPATHLHCDIWTNLLPAERVCATVTLTSPEPARLLAINRACCY